MIEHGNTVFDAGLFLRALLTGFLDGLNPCVFAHVLIFIIYASVVGTTAQRILWIGGLYVLVSGAVIYASLTGILDGLITMPGFIVSTRVIFLFSALGFIMLSLFEILDWANCKKQNSVSGAKLPLPAFLRQSAMMPVFGLWTKIRRFTRLFTITLLVALIATLAALAYPQSEFIYIVYSFWLSGSGNKWLVYQLFFLYSLAMCVWLIIAWMKIWWMAKKRKQSLKAILYYKMVLSAIYLSTGVGLAFYYL